MREVLVYSVLRLALFGVVWWLLMLAGMHYLVAGALAALVAMLMSILFLRRPREGVAQRWKAADDRRRAKRSDVTDEDADEEDAILDRAGDEQQPSTEGRREVRRGDADGRDDAGRRDGAGGSDDADGRDGAGEERGRPV